MKKILALTLTFVLLVGLLSGCSGQNNSNDAQVKNNSNDTAQESTGSTSSDKVYTIKVAHGITEKQALHMGWVKFKEIVEEKSNGKMKIEIYPNQQLGGDREYTEATQIGNVQIASPSGSPLASFCKEFYVLDIPFLFKDKETAYRVLDGEAGQALLKALEKSNLKGLGFFDNGFRNLTNSKVPVRKPEDLKGLKIRTMENDVHLAAWKMLGSNPTPMAWGEVFTALQQKTIDGQENPFETIYTNKLYEVQKYATETNHIFTPYVAFINKEFYEQLPKEYQQIIDDAIKVAIDYQREEAKKLDTEAQTSMDGKIEIIRLTDEELQAFKDKTAPVLDMVKEKAGEEIVNKFMEAVK